MNIEDMSHEGKQERRKGGERRGAEIGVDVFGPGCRKGSDRRKQPEAADPSKADWGCYCGTQNKNSDVCCHGCKQPRPTEIVDWKAKYEALCITLEDARELQSVLRTLSHSGPALITSARQLVEKMEKAEAECKRLRMEWDGAEVRVGKNYTVILKLRDQIKQIETQLNAATTRAEAAEAKLRKYECGVHDVADLYAEEPPCGCGKTEYGATVLCQQHTPAPQKIELICTRCGKPITEGRHVGDGDGTGQRFAHYNCYYPPAPQTPSQTNYGFVKPELIAAMCGDSPVPPAKTEWQCKISAEDLPTGVKAILYEMRDRIEALDSSDESEGVMQRGYYSKNTSLEGTLLGWFWSVPPSEAEQKDRQEIVILTAAEHDALEETENVPKN